MDLSKLANILKNDDIILAVGLVVIVCMMIIPLPAFCLDILLTINISLAVIILLVLSFLLIFHIPNPDIFYQEIPE